MKKTYYFLSILILFIFNINVVNALETNFSNLLVQGYNNNGNSLTIPSVFNCNEVGSCGMEITTLANSYGGFWSIQSPIPMLNNHNYAVTLQVRSSNVPVTLSSKYNLSIGNTLDDAKTNYANSRFYNDLLFYKDSGNSTLQYIFTAKTSATYIGIPFTTVSNTTANFMIDSIIIEDLGDKALTESEINNITNNQTSILQNDINNLNENINNTLKNNFNDCYTNLFNLNGLTLQHANITYLNNGFMVDSDRYWSYAYYSINLPKGTYTLSGEINGNVDFVEMYVNDVWLTGARLNSGSYTFDLNSDSLVTLRFYATTGDVTTGSSTFYRIQLENGSSAHSYIEYGTEVCKNKLDNLNDTQKETNDKLDDLNDNITNSDSSGASDEASDFFGSFNTDTFGLTSVITAPLELIKSITSKSCSPLQLTLPFVNKELNLPCLSTIYENYFGSFLTIYRTITFGFVSYWVCIKIFNLVKDFKNPEHDEIEVLDL